MPRDLRSAESPNLRSEAKRIDDSSWNAARAEGRPQAFSSLVNELAEKYGCSEEPGASDSEQDVEIDGTEIVKRNYLPPNLQPVRKCFQEALDSALEAASARTSLQFLLQEAPLEATAIS